MLQRDVALFDRFSVHVSQKPLERGDIVAVQYATAHLNPPSTLLTTTNRSPIKPGQLLVKRVVALAGDTVQTLASYPRGEVIIPQGHIWVEGRAFDWHLAFSIPNITLRR
jgi:mitochondrial inner membrane protease subunit 2